MAESESRLGTAHVAAQAMNTRICVWQGWPDTDRLCQAHEAAQGEPQDWLIISPQWRPAHLDHDSTHPLAAQLCQRLHTTRQLYQQQPVLCIPDILPQTRLLLIRPDAVEITPTDPTATPSKPWLAWPAPVPVRRVLIVGAGIAGAATAYALARRGVPVDVVDSGAVAAAASGNRQGLLYAKIAAHNTVQSELLLAGYAFSRQLLAHTLQPSQGWWACGVLHLDHNAPERKRNSALAAQQPHSSLYRYVERTAAERLAGIPLPTGGLWWPHGVALHPQAWVKALLHHPLISVHARTRIDNPVWRNGLWQAQAQTRSGRLALAASHVVWCAGAASGRDGPLQGWPFQPIRGQTTVAAAPPSVQALRCAISGHSYISPPWQQHMCFGATFVPGDAAAELRADDDAHNWQQLAALLPALADDIHAAHQCHPQPHGHAAVRCDAYDHLPVVGPVGDAMAMRERYVQLALDKHYRLDAPCPFVPNTYVNTAHGSRGLATAPLCAETVACQMLGLPVPLSMRVQTAVHPNRLPVHSLVHHLPWPMP